MCMCECVGVGGGVRVSLCASGCIFLSVSVCVPGSGVIVCCFRLSFVILLEHRPFADYKGNPASSTHARYFQFNVFILLLLYFWFSCVHSSFVRSCIGAFSFLIVCLCVASRL